MPSLAKIIDIYFHSALCFNKLHCALAINSKLSSIFSTSGAVPFWLLPAETERLSYTTFILFSIPLSQSPLISVSLSFYHLDPIRTINTLTFPFCCLSFISINFFSIVLCIFICKLFLLRIELLSNEVEWNFQDVYKMNKRQNQVNEALKVEKKYR